MLKKFDRKSTFSRKVQFCYQDLLEIIQVKLEKQEPAEREKFLCHTLRTPERVASVWNEFLSGYEEDYARILKVQFPAPLEQSDMITLRGISFVSVCMHHLLPFFGKVDIAYIPDANIVGLSKLARLVDACARRLQLQEHLTREICCALEQHLQPLGVAVKISAVHCCLSLRGVGKTDTHLVTQKRTGQFEQDETKWRQFMETCSNPFHL